jgi:hypothetical protein
MVDERLSGSYQLIMNATAESKEAKLYGGYAVGLVLL